MWSDSVLWLHSRARLYMYTIASAPLRACDSQELQERLARTMIKYMVLAGSPSPSCHVLKCNFTGVWPFWPLKTRKFFWRARASGARGALRAHTQTPNPGPHPEHAPLSGARDGTRTFTEIYRDY